MTNLVSQGKTKRKVKKRVKRKLNINRLRKSLVIAVLIYFILMSIPAIVASNTKTIPVEKGTIVNSIEAHGMILKDEHVYRAKSKGNVLFYLEEGSKVGKGIRVAEISNETYKDYKAEIEGIDKEITSNKERIASQQEILKKDIAKNQEEIDEIVKQVQENVAKQNYEEVKRLKDKLLIVSNKKDAINNENTYISDQNEVLMKKKSEVTNKMKQSSLAYYTEMSGFVSHKLDGLEEKYSSRNIGKYTIKDLDEIKTKDEFVKNEQLVKIEEPIFKIISDQRWYIMTKVEDKDLGEIEQGSKVSLEVNKHKGEIEGTVFKLDKSKKGSFIIVELDKYIHEFYDKRYIDIKLIKEIKTGMQVPKKSIVDKEGQKGVYIKEISGVVKFLPVNVLSETENISIVESADEDKPLQIYDEVFAEGKNMKEGQIVNYRGGD